MPTWVIALMAFARTSRPLQFCICVAGRKVQQPPRPRAYQPEGDLTITLFTALTLLCQPSHTLPSRARARFLVLFNLGQREIEVNFNTSSPLPVPNCDFPQQAGLPAFDGLAQHEPTCLTKPRSILDISTSRPPSVVRLGLTLSEHPEGG